MQVNNKKQWVGIGSTLDTNSIYNSICKNGGAQISKHLSVTNTTGTVHTVTAAKTLQLVMVNFFHDAGGAGISRIFVSDGSDTEQYTLFRTYTAINLPQSNSFNFPRPLEIPAGYKIKIITNHADLTCFVYIFGEEI